MKILVICTLVIQLASGGRDVIQAEGELLNDDFDKWKVNFETEIKKYPKKDQEYNVFVKWINGNSCLYK